MTSKRKTVKAHTRWAAPGKGKAGDAALDDRMVLAERIMGEDEEILRVLGDVMSRRRAALGKLAK